MARFYITSNVVEKETKQNCPQGIDSRYYIALACAFPTDIDPDNKLARISLDSVYDFKRLAMVIKSVQLKYPELLLSKNLLGSYIISGLKNCAELIHIPYQEG